MAGEWEQTSDPLDDKFKLGQAFDTTTNKVENKYYVGITTMEDGPYVGMVRKHDGKDKLAYSYDDDIKKTEDFKYMKTDSQLYKIDNNGSEPKGTICLGYRKIPVYLGVANLTFRGNKLEVPGYIEDGKCHYVIGGNDFTTQSFSFITTEDDDDNDGGEDEDIDVGEIVPVHRRQCGDDWEDESFTLGRNGNLPIAFAITKIQNDIVVGKVPLCPKGGTMLPHMGFCYYHLGQQIRRTKDFYYLKSSPNSTVENIGAPPPNARKVGKQDKEVYLAIVNIGKHKMPARVKVAGRPYTATYVGKGALAVRTRVEAFEWVVPKSNYSLVSEKGENKLFYRNGLALALGLFGDKFRLGMVNVARSPNVCFGIDDGGRARTTSKFYWVVRTTENIGKRIEERYSARGINNVMSDISSEYFAVAKNQFCIVQDGKCYVINFIKGRLVPFCKRIVDFKYLSLP